CSIVKSVLISGSADIQGCGHRILPGGVEVPGSCSEGFVQGRDAGDLQEPGLSGNVSFRPECPLLVGAREGALDSEWPRGSIQACK
ncbi:Hypothetical predicted protein, partial [Marmota monax]